MLEVWKVKRIFFLRRMLDNAVFYASLWEFVITKGFYSRLVRREKLDFDVEVCIVEQKSCLKDESCTRVFPSGQVFISLGYRRSNEGNFSTSLTKNLKSKRAL